ncbi:hypothetical protein JCM19275_3061 [Nonlabens ulvanivorans]|uniref:Uncharacterized protein n=2 Tax=Nonlabens ulvanivorans TaxID=906888 RepID=A0A090WFL9_NONUL|nr:hypothetical protein [Nonlabens ulvanivorans]GAL74214.1 hypothetical protein JCM19275_3061 [Nonlabens ulvanivorans]
MKKVVFLIVIPLILSFTKLENSEKVLGGPDQRICCKMGSHNGENGEDLIYVSVSSCVTFSSPETLGDARARACVKAQNNARRAVAILQAAP